MKELENCSGTDMKQNSDKIMADKMKGTKNTKGILPTLVLSTLNQKYQPKGALLRNFINLTDI